MLNVHYTVGTVHKMKNIGSKVLFEFRTLQKDKDKKVKVSHWKASFVGKSLEKSLQLKEGDKITITCATISNLLLDGQKKSDAMLCIKDFEIGNTLLEHIERKPF